jgi:hypothetical protein
MLKKLGFYVPLINGKLYDELKLLYTGGSVDMFLPSIPEGEKAYCYDVNSFYPNSMNKDMFMPVFSKQIKYIIYFEGNLFLLKNNVYGFFNINIETTKKLN